MNQRLCSVFSSLWLLSALVALTVALPFLTDTTVIKESYFFEVQMLSEDAGLAQVFADNGRGFNEADSSTLPLRPGSDETYRFPLPANTYCALRFDPSNRAGTVTIRSARVVSSSGRVLRDFTLEQLFPEQQFARVDYVGKARRFRTVADANDPAILLTPFPPLTLDVDFRDRFRWLLPWSVGAAALVWLTGWAATFRLVATAQAWARRRPRTAVCVVAALGVAWQMHPVVFAHRSLVSPDDGPVPLLYSDAPTLPGCPSSEPDDGLGSDVGALMWAHVPYAAVQHEAVFHDHDWPLWDRYNLCGLPLLGQGQSMFGDPLHWLVVVTDSASWAWDAKFVLARWLFACGLGLAALQLGAGLAGALPAAFSAAFIGFFSFRYNHPAIFSICYAPWIVVAWSGLVQARGRRAIGAWLGALMAATWMAMTSGTVKEAAMLIAGLHLAGVLVLLRSAQPAGERGRKLLAAAAAGGVFALLSAPWWLSFLILLSYSFSNYDLPNAGQILPWQFVGFFDDMFYRLLRPNDQHGLPSANFLVLLGVGWSLVRWRVLPGRRAWGALLVSACVPLSLAFGVVPATLLMRIPLIANIHHIDNTFSCVLLVHALLLATFGWRQLFVDLGTPDWAVHWRQYAAGVAVLLALYFGSTQNVPKIGFFAGYVPTLVIAIIVLPWLAHRAVHSQRQSVAIVALAACAALCLWRHGEYRRSPFDYYVINPGQRVALRGTSPALEFAKRRSAEPARFLGLDFNLFPGYGAMAGVETIYGIDALRSRPYHQLAQVLHFDRVWDWSQQDDEATVAAYARARDMLGVRYYLATHRGAPRPIPGLRLLGQFDLDVYERPEAWPRAFFTDAVLLYAELADVVRHVESGDGRPFATVRLVDRREVPRARVIAAATADRVVQPAFDYQLGSNRTTFRVNATGPGVIVLGEAHYKHDFEALLDGRPVPYFRVNHAFKGIQVDTAGEHTVSFRYRPQYFSLALGLAATGLALLAAAALFLRRPVKADAPPGPDA
jgi:hypothetical protein